MPGEVESEVAVRDTDRIELDVERAEAVERALERLFVADDADILPHHIVERLANRLDVAGGMGKRRPGAQGRALDRRFVDRSEPSRYLDPARHRIARNAAEHG